MNITLPPSVLCGALDAIPSKSHAHRLIICASLSDRPCTVICPATSRDIEATADCMRALGARITRVEHGYEIIPISLGARQEEAVLECGESGSTLRFLLPCVCALGVRARFLMQGRLPDRPLSPLYEILCEGGVTLSGQGSNPLCTSGSFHTRDISISADVSSQFISGLMFASPLMGGEVRIHLTTAPESTGYIDMTVDCMRRFGIEIELSEQGGLRTYTLRGEYRTPSDTVEAEGDWSNAAFWLAAGAIGSAPVAVRGLCGESLQPDMAIVDILRRFGADVEVSDDKYVVSPAGLEGCEIDVRETPDLVPAICVIAACAMGRTVIRGGARLRLKESDRIESTCEMVRSLGGEAEPTEDGMIIHGTGIAGGEVDSFGDHRIAMAAAIACAASAQDITVIGAQSTEKSYPGFFDDMRKITIVC